MERTHMECCIGCRNYQRCKVFYFEDGIVCAKWKIGRVMERIRKIFWRK